MSFDIKNIDKSTQDFINSNNLFVEEGDPFVDFVQSNIEGIHTFGKPNASVRVKKVKSSQALMYPSQLVFEANYTFDSKGRRETTSIPGNKEQVSIFFGDSQLFGEGLNNNETLPYYFESLNPTYQSFNYGFLGHGPAQMLYRINTEEFQSEFRDKKGKAFFLYRDDAIKTSVGEIPWGDGYPKYEIINSELQYVGAFGGDSYKPDSMYLPSMYTDYDYKLTLEIFKEINKKLPKGIEFYVVAIPLSFTNYKMQDLLESNNINFLNFYSTDLEYLTGKKARFLDGVHTKYSNQILAKRLTYYLNENIPNYKLGYTEYTEESQVYDRLLLESIFIPTMVDFPVDDAGVIVSNILKHYKGTTPLDPFTLLDYLKTQHAFKLNTLGEGKIEEYLSSIKSGSLNNILIFEFKTMSSYINLLKFYQ